MSFNIVLCFGQNLASVCMVTAVDGGGSDEIFATSANYDYDDNVMELLAMVFIVDFATLWWILMMEAAIVVCVDGDGEVG